MANVDISGRLHSIATGNVVAGANEILDDDLSKKQSQINAETYGYVQSINDALEGLSPEQQEALSVSNKANNNEAKLGYYVCTTEGNIAAKTIAAPNYILSLGGNIKIKMAHANSASGATLNINSTGPKTLLYNGEPVSSDNTWEDNDVISVYYDGACFMASNSQSGGKADSQLDENSTLPVQNKVVTQAINTISANLQDVGEDILYKLGGQENIPFVIENGKGWKADLTDVTGNYYKRSIVDIVVGDTYILSFRTAGGANKTCWADDNGNVIGSPIDGGQNMKKVAPTGATKLYISTNTTGTPNTMKVVHIIDSQYVKVVHEGENVLLDDTMSNASVWKKDQYYAGDGVFSVANNILTINNSSGRKFVQRTLQVSDKYDANAWYRFSFTLRRTTSTYKNRIQIGTCYASTAGTNHDYYDMIMPTTSFKTYSFIGKIYATYGMIKIGAETAFDTIEVSEVLVEKLTDEEYKSLDYLNPLGITYGQSLQKIIDKYPRVHLPAGTTELSYPLEIPNGHTIVGAVGGTTLKLVEGTTCILLSNKLNITISNISFVGEAAITPTDVSTTDIKSRTGEGTTSGICLQTNVNRNIVIDNCKFANFSKAGIYSHNPFNYSYSQFLRVTNCCAINCWCGIILDERAEYNIVSDCAFIYCQYGALVIGGNNKFSNCAFEANGVGFVVNGTTDGSTTAANNSHGIIVNSSFNHCISYGVFVFRADSGFTFTGCHTYGNTSAASKGGIYISNSRGVNYNGGVIGCQIDIDAMMSGLNMISDSLFDGGSYNSGTINGDKSKLSMHGNRDYKGIIDKATINNDL